MRHVLSVEWVGRRSGGKSRRLWSGGRLNGHDLRAALAIEPDYAEERKRVFARLVSEEDRSQIAANSRASASRVAAFNCHLHWRNSLSVFSREAQFPTFSTLHAFTLHMRSQAAA